MKTASRTFATMMLVIATALALAAPAAVAHTASPDVRGTDIGTMSTYRSGYSPCTGTMQVYSWASGSVYHRVDGLVTGFYYNGSYQSYNVSYGQATNGWWSVSTSFDGSISGAGGWCLG